MKIFLAQQNYHIGHLEHNVQKIIEAIETAKGQGADLILFSELSVCGYPPRDLLYFDDFIVQCEKAISNIAGHTQGIAAIVGAPRRNPSPLGKNLFNAAYFLADGQVRQIIHKTCLPTYDVFDEDRYFAVASDWKTVEFKGKKIAITICEDIWNMGDDPLYVKCPMDELTGQHPDFMVNLSASPFDYTHDQDRKAILKANVLKYGIPVFYCNAVGSQTEIVFDGQSLVFDKSGQLCGELASFKEDLQGFILNEDGFIELGNHLPQKVADEISDPVYFEPELNIGQIYQALVLGIRDYFEKMGFSKAILGSSGGIDSAVTLAIACDALGAENVHAVLMPSQFSSAHSVEDAVLLSTRLGNPYSTIPIKDVFTSFMKELEPHFAGKPFGLAEENNQSRIRGNVLMTLANKFGQILLNTSNKSELATGYGTLYGDMAGGLAILGDCYKLQVYALARHINRFKEIIPDNIITKPPSAELRPNQKDSDSLPEYEILDPILYQYIEHQKSPADIKAMGMEEALVDKILKMVNTNEYKRNQFCPIIRVSPKAFGPGRRMPIVGKYLS
jgi:NAD+ synthase (glutamine-hydrolysing)